MCKWRKYVVLGLVVYMMYLPLAGAGLAANGTRCRIPSLTKQQVNQFDVGAKVKIELATGKERKGSIQSVEEEEFLLASNHADSPTRIAYDQVSQVKLAKITYHAKGQPDATEAKRVAAGLGVGHYIMVKTTEAKEYHGNLLAIAAENLTVLPDRTAAQVQIALSKVLQLGLISAQERK